ncbi:hypothetical protein J0J24_24155, partial [Vibrio vulnificus]|uniref:type IIL restriction-modification enzyme MmeI n=2 Tax=Vibrio TaxID=662 RepID=UPI001AD45BDC|nr:hypothetical protein [Vibrio vulnificus]
ENSAYAILEAREDYPELSLAELYDPDKMPSSLVKAHEANDRLVSSIYSSKEFTNDESKLKILLEQYGKMVGGKNA